MIFIPEMHCFVVDIFDNIQNYIYKINVALYIRFVQGNKNSKLFSLFFSGRFYFPENSLRNWRSH